MLTTIRQDITKLAVECIVNAANESGLGCFTPGHPCIDNAIHRAAGPGLLEECLKLKQVTPGVRIPTGQARITYAHSLPCKYIIHAVGPQVDSKSEVKRNRKPNYPLLAQTYQTCLDLAELNGIKQVAFCCISTGIFGHDKEYSAQTAIVAVIDWLSNKQAQTLSQGQGQTMQVIFVTYTDQDEKIYNRLLNQILK